MKLWKDNKIDAERDMPVEEIARLYMESEWPDRLMDVERKLRIFMTSQDGPISSVWEDEEEFARLLDQVIELERQHDEQPAAGRGDAEGAAR